MLDQEQLTHIPINTRKNWNKFKHEDYDCEDWVKPYLENFEDIKQVYIKEHLRKTMMILLTISKGYSAVFSSVTKNKKLLQNNEEVIVNSINKLITVSGIKVARACQFYGVSKDWFYREKSKLPCSLSIFKRCFKQHPNQLTPQEVSVIAQTIFDQNNFGKTKTTLYYAVLRKGLLYCAKSTFCKYATALGYQKPKHKKRSAKKGFRATKVFEWLHVDITYVPTLNDGMQKVAFVKDNFSKAILHYKSTNEKAGSEFIATLFQETFEKYDLFNQPCPINILSDGGPENKGQFISWIKHIKAPPVVNKITARTDEFPFSNSMSESTHSILKTEFLKKQVSKNETEHLKNLNKFVLYYNNERFPGELLGLKPLEVVDGKTPDKNYFKENIQQSRKNRIAINQNFNDCPMSSIGR